MSFIKSLKRVMPVLKCLSYFVFGIVLYISYLSPEVIAEFFNVDRATIINSDMYTIQIPGYVMNWTLFIVGVEVVDNFLGSIPNE